MNCQLVVCKSDCDGIGNILKGYITALSINNDSVIECNPDYMYGQYDTILDDKHIYKETSKNIKRVYTCRLLILKDEENIQDNIFNEFQSYNGIGNSTLDNLFCSKLIDFNYDSNIINPIIKNRIFANINKILFNNIVLQSTNLFCETFKEDITLGISIRTWNSKHEHNICRPYNSETYILKIKEVLINHPNINKLIISIDNTDYLNEYISFLNYLNDTKLLIILNKSDSINDIQYAMCKVLILAKCNYYIGNRISTFSELVFWFSKHKTKVYTVF